MAVAASRICCCGVSAETNAVRPRWTGINELSSKITRAIRYSFHAPSPWITATAAMPGRASGRITLANTRSGEAPSSWAASSRSRGWFAKKLRMMSVAIGMPAVMRMQMYPMRELLSPREISSLYCARNIAGAGMIMTARMMAWNSPLPAKSSRARAYPAMLAAARMPTTAAPVYRMLLSRYRPSSPSTHAVT
jgi:hypothetical protein